MNYEIVSEEFELKEGLKKGNKSFEKTIKLHADKSRRLVGVQSLPLS